MSTYEMNVPTAERRDASAADQAKEKARRATGDARSRLRDQVDQRSTQAGEQMAGAAADTRSVAEHLRSQGKERPATLADQAAERIERAGDYLKRADGDAILRDAERIGRDRPWAVVVGGFALGFAASRFMKASGSRRYRELERPPSRPTYDAGATPAVPPAPPAPSPTTR